MTYEELEIGGLLKCDICGKTLSRNKKYQIGSLGLENNYWDYKKVFFHSLEDFNNLRKFNKVNLLCWEHRR